MARKIIIPLLIVSLLSMQMTKPVSNDDPRLIATAAVGVGAVVSGAWLVAKGVEQMFGIEKSDIGTVHSICKRILGLPVAVAGVGVCVAGVVTIVGGKDGLSGWDSSK